MKKKLIAVIMVTMLALSMAACGSETEETTEISSAEEEIYYADEDFIADMANGLQARWALNAANEAEEGYDEISVTSQEWADMLVSYVDAELEYISKYPDETFEDNHLKELALSYVNLLNDHKDLIDYITVDYDKYYEEYDEIYNERSTIIATLVSDYGLTVDEEYQDTLDDFLTNATLVEEEENVQTEIDSMVAAIEFELVEDDYGYKTYEAVVENTTSMDFDSMSFDISLLDDDGVILSTEYAYVDNFSQGAKAKLEFMTDEDFTSYEIIAEYY